VVGSGPVFSSPSTWQPPQAADDGFVRQSSPSGAVADCVWQVSQNNVDCGYVTSLKSNSPVNPHTLKGSARASPRWIEWVMYAIPRSSPVSGSTVPGL
jgi:hypothetical protein